MRKRFKVSPRNSKLGEIPSINLPALESCIDNPPCESICYANNGRFNFSGVKECYRNNMLQVIENLALVEQDILDQLPTRGYCRIASSGDIPSREYFEMLVRIANKLPDVLFLLYTKQYEIVNSYMDDFAELPKNMIVYFSLWPDFPCDNRYGFSEAGILLDEGPVDCRIREDALLCSKKCDKCFACWHLPRGSQVLFKQHGRKRKKLVLVGDNVGNT